MHRESLIVTFPSVHLSLRGERVAQEAGIQVRMVPVPRQISSDCNMGMEASIDCMDLLRSILAHKGIECHLVRWRE